MYRIICDECGVTQEQYADVLEIINKGASHEVVKGVHWCRECVEALLVSRYMESITHRDIAEINFRWHKG